MRYVYTQAIVTNQQLESEGPGAIKFRSALVEADDDSKAYLEGQRWADQFTYHPEFETINDIVVPIDGQVN